MSATSLGWRLWALTAGLLCFAASARAQVLFSDDVESGAIFAPTGHWNSKWLPDPLNTLSATAAAAHRGNFGIELDDVDGDAGVGGQDTAVENSLARTGDFYVREWVRVRSSNDAGLATLLQIANATNPAGIHSEIKLANPGGILLFSGYSSTPDGGLLHLEDATQARLGTGDWHLVELGLKGVGTSTGQRSLWVDGVPMDNHQGLNWSSAYWVIDQVLVGEPWSGDMTFTGTVDVDDVRFSGDPPASRVSFTPPPVVTVGRCMPVAVGLNDSSGHPASAPYALTVNVWAAPPLVGIFSDATCSTPASGVALVGADAGVLYLSALDAGTVGLTGTHPDFLSSSTAVRLSATVASVTPASQTADAGTWVTLDGTGSRAGPGLSLTAFLWQQQDGPTGLRFVDGGVQRLLFPVPGDYVVTLSVQDSDGVTSAPTTARVHVAGNLAAAPTALGCASTPGGTSVSVAGLVLACLVLGRACRGGRRAGPGRG